MRIATAYSFLVHPSKHEEKQPEIGGTQVLLDGDLGFMLQNAFTRAVTECSIDIAFQMASDGSQENEIRDLVVQLVKVPSLERAKALAKKLQSVTTNRSGLGLFFVLIGDNEEGTRKRVYLARFPADNGIVAEEDDDQLRVEFIEQVFMKNALSYKAVVYEGSSGDADFWEGRAIDKQVSNNSVAISGYWIRDFLKSDFKTTSAIGTRRFALALKETIHNCQDLSVKEELTAVATLAKNFKNKVVSIENFGERFGLSNAATTAMSSALAKPSFQFTQFKFSVQEFQKHVRYRQMQLSNGASLSAPAGKFDECFTREPAEDGEGEVQITTRGRVVDEALRNSR